MVANGWVNGRFFPALRLIRRQAVEALSTVPAGGAGLLPQIVCTL